MKPKLPNKKLTIAVSGKKFSGKTSLCQYIKAYYAGQNHVNLKFDQKPTGEIVWYRSTGHPLAENAQQDLTDELDAYVKIYNFADNLKDLCINVLGLTKDQVWGSEADKNSLTQFKWDNLSHDIRVRNASHFVPAEHSEYGKAYGIPREGHMTAREVMQVMGTDIMRKMFYDRVWVDSTIRKINNDNVIMALIADMRFRSEFHPLHESGGYIIRLGRKVFEDGHSSETDFDNFDFTKYERCLYIPPECGIAEKNAMAVEWIDKIIQSTL